MADLDLARIKGNVAKMAAQGAPEADIDGYIASEGTSIDAIRDFKPAAALSPEFAGGMAGAGALGAADTVSFGFGDELGAGLGAASEYLASKITGETPRSYSELLAAMRDQDARAKEQNPGSYIAGQIGGGLVGGAGLARGGLSLGANAINAGRTLPRVAAASAGDGAIIGALSGAGAGETAEDRAQGAAMGGAIGTALGGAVPFAISGLSAGVRRAISPIDIAPERQAQAAILRAEGINPTAGQVSGNKALRYAESEIGGARTARLMDEQAEAFTDAAMRRVGGNGLADPDNLAANRARISQGFDDVASRNTVRADHQLVRDMNDTMREYARVLPSEQRAIVRDMGQDIVDRFRAGSNSMSGRDYQTIRSRLTTRAQRARGSDEELAAAYRGLRNSLDDAMARQVAPDDAGQWQTLRQQWGNLRTLERAASAGGENAALGYISPAQLRIASSQGNRGGYARGQGDFAQLARAGNALLSPLPNSGTAARTAARNLGAGALAGGGALTAGAAGMVAGMAAPAIAGRVLMSPVTQRFLQNQLMNGNISDAARRQLQALLLGASAPGAGRLAAP